MPRFAGHKYTMKPLPLGSSYHKWELRGPDGGVHFHVRLSRADGFPPTAGLEIHRCTPADYQRGEAPHHLDCPITGGRCWHDGTSLYASEILWPMIETYLNTGDHHSVFGILEREYDERFGDGEAALTD